MTRAKFDAQSRALKSRCFGTTQRDEVGREVGVGFRMAAGGWEGTCAPLVDSSQGVAGATTVL